MLYLIALVVVPYMIFVFFGHGFNPLTKPSPTIDRSRWKHGRKMALCAFVGGTTTVIAAQAALTQVQVAIGLGILVATLCAGVLCARKISNFLWGE